jgi:hypothetical protein
MDNGNPLLQQSKLIADVGKSIVVTFIFDEFQNQKMMKFTLPISDFHFNLSFLL